MNKNEGNGVNDLKHLLDMTSLTLDQIQEILLQAERLRKGKSLQTQEPVFIANLFFEPSTRTRFSFEVAEKKLGYEV
ncbi:hypothetical protein R0J90_18015, partial [Micrococcus sp. SIMBA_144]